jgi:DNA polymerase-3 subunit gamma/tau
MASSFGSFGPAGPGFGSIQNAPAGGANPTAFPTAPPPAIGSGGLAPGGLGGVAGPQGSLGNMVGVNLQQPSQGPAPQPYRAPLPQAPPPLAAAAAPAAPPLAAGPPPNAPNDLLYGLNPGGSGAGPAFGGGSGSLFGLGGGGGMGSGQVGAGGNPYYANMGNRNVVAGGNAGNGGP